MASAGLPAPSSVTPWSFFATAAFVGGANVARPTGVVGVSGAALDVLAEGSGATGVAASVGGLA